MSETTAENETQKPELREYEVQAVLTTVQKVKITIMATDTEHARELLGTAKDLRMVDLGESSDIMVLTSPILLANPPEFRRCQSQGSYNCHE